MVKHKKSAVTLLNARKLDHKAMPLKALLGAWSELDGPDEGHGVAIIWHAYGCDVMNGMRVMAWPCSGMHAGGCDVLIGGVHRG